MALKVIKSFVEDILMECDYQDWSIALIDKLQVSVLESKCICTVTNSTDETEVDVASSRLINCIGEALRGEFSVCA